MSPWCQSVKAVRVCTIRLIVIIIIRLRLVLRHADRAAVGTGVGVLVFPVTDRTDGGRHGETLPDCRVGA